MTEQVSQETTAEQKTADIEAGMKMGYADEPPAAPVEKVEVPAAEPVTTEAAPVAAAKTTDDKKPDPKPKPAAKPAPATEGDILKKVGDLVDGRLRNFKGDFSKTLDERLKALTPTDVAAATKAAVAAGGDTPTKAEVTAALASTEKMKALEQDFPDFAAALKEQAANLEQSILAKMPKPKDPDKVDMTKFVPIETFSTVEQEVFDLRVEQKHPGYAEKVNSEVFKEWFAQQSPEVQALGASMNWRDGIAFLDKFAEHEKTLADKAKNPQPNPQDRLRAAVAPKTGANKPPATGGSVEDGMRFGYQNA